MNRYCHTQYGMITMSASESFWRVNDLRLEEPTRRARGRVSFLLRQDAKRRAAGFAHLVVIGEALARRTKSVGEGGTPSCCP